MFKYVPTFLNWASKQIGQVNKTIVHVNESRKSELSEGNNKITTCADKEKQTSSVYDIKGK